ncbi:hypothetical protein MLD38_014126 [Melastoma candidum]|uniref:Uncharacterized protein n=1 Tax=Melastoma candidum TaxID=119954 RepID=A0ACB9RK75_9MYRT|nr:hypothetical protein MLD38_014126 [Melastoma candidum]
MRKMILKTRKRSMWTTGAVPALKEEEEDDKNFTVAAPPQVEDVHKEIEDKEEEIASDNPKGEEEEAEVPKAILESVEAEDKDEDKPVVEAVDVAAEEEKESGEGAKEPDVVTPGTDEPEEVKEPEVVNVEDEKQALPEMVQQRIEKPAAAASPAAKKDPAQANNDIIEETTKKLMESSRRNKVKALAGAFETVISLEKPGQA